MKAQVYKIFNDIQTRTNTTENLESFIEVFEKSRVKEFNEVIENVVLIVFKNYEKNNVILKNIKDFLKSFLEKIIKLTKVKESTKSFINNFCKLFTSNVKKHKYKTLCIYFLNIFLMPYSNNFAVFYTGETLEEIKGFILTILKSKQTSLHFAVVKLLQKHTILQKEADVWERLEALLNNSTQVIKKEILKLLEIDNENILNYLLEMYDDDSIEIRHFVFEKLSEIKNFDLLDPSSKVKLFFVGLSDNNHKVQTAAKKFLKNYLQWIGVYKSKKAKNQMMVDEEGDFNINKNLDTNFKKLSLKKIEEESDDEEKDEQLLASEKIAKSSSPMKQAHKKRLTDSASRVFDKLDIRRFYNHPKYSYTFQLITEAIVEFTENENIIGYLKGIVENLKASSNSQPDMRFLSSEKKSRSLNDSLMSSHSLARTDKFELFNDIYFLQNCVKYFANKHDENSQNLKNQIFELLPDNRTFSKIVEFFYKEQPNIMILHQLFLIASHLNYDDELGSQEMFKILKKFITDLTLDAYTISDFSFRKIELGNNLNSQPSDINHQEEISEEGLVTKTLENILLPPTRKIIHSMEDLVEYALKILHRIYYTQPGQLFNEIMASLNEMNEPLEIDKENPHILAPLKAKQKDLIENLKDKMSTIGLLEEKKKKEKNRIEIEKKINKEKNELENLEDELYRLTNEERNIIIRKLKLCDFLIKYSRQPQPMFENMVNTIILPALSRKDFPEVCKLSFNVMGLLAISFFQSQYKAFLKLFFDQIEKQNYEFGDFEMSSLLIVFDSILQNNLAEHTNIFTGTIEEKIDYIIKKYLYHADPVPRIIAYTGLCKLLIANRIGKPEYVIARLINVLYKTFDLTERKDEDYHVKIFEITQSFLYAYCSLNKSHIKSVVKAILIILTSQLISDQTNNFYDKTIAGNFAETKIEFLNSFLMIVNDFAYEHSSMKKIVFKIFKYLYFFYNYACGDIEKAVRNEEDYKRGKKFELNYKTKEKVKSNIKRFFEKTKYDKFLANEMADEASFLKIFPFALILDDNKFLKNFSEPLLQNLETVKNKNFIYEYSGNQMDLSSEEKQNELRQTVINKENKYYKQIEEYQAFIHSLRNVRLNTIIEENSRLYEDEESVLKQNESRTSIISRKSRNKTSTSGLIRDEVEQHEAKDQEANQQDSNIKSDDKKEKRGVKRKASKTPDDNKKKSHKRKK